MRPSDLFCWLPSPASFVGFVLQEEWRAAALVAIILGLAAMLVRPLLLAFIEDVQEEGGFWNWFSRALGGWREVETLRTDRTGEIAKRRRRRLEAKQERRELKREAAEQEEQLELFRW